MRVRLHPHAQERLEERGAIEEEVIATVEDGEQFPAKYNRIGFRKNFTFDGIWRGPKLILKAGYFTDYTLFLK